MANVLLIKTRILHPPRGFQSYSPPLGLMYLAAYARQQRPGQDSFTLVDEMANPKSLSQWRDYLGRNSFDCIGISALSIESDYLEILVPALKEAAPQTPIILGGPYATSSKEFILKTLPVDYLIQGEGETAFVALLEALDKGQTRPESSISGLVFLDQTGFMVENPENRDLVDLNALPFPAWDLIDVQDYQYGARMTPSVKGSRYAALFTSRGCPYHCIYCHEIFPKKHIRMMSPLRVVDEMEHLVTHYDIAEFEIYDDIFNLDAGRVLAICAEIKRRGLKIKLCFPNGVRGDLLNEEVLRALKSAGTIHMAVAIESANPRVQKLIKKHVDLEKIKANIALAADLGIFTWGFFMIGFPTETRQEIWNTLKFAFSSKLHGASFFQVFPHEGTKLFEMCSSLPNFVEQKKGSDYHYGTQSLSQVGLLETNFYVVAGYIAFFFAPWRAIRIWSHSMISRKMLFFSLGRLLRYATIDKPGFILGKALSWISRNDKHPLKPMHK